MSDELKDALALVEKLKAEKSLVERQYVESESKHLARQVSTEPDLTYAAIASHGEVMYVDGRVALVRKGTGTELSDFAKSEEMSGKLGKFAKADTGSKKTDDDAKKETKPNGRPTPPVVDERGRPDYKNMSPADKLQYIRDLTKFRKANEGRGQ